MADLSTDCAGIKSPNPFWLASAPPANSAEQVMRAFEYGWGGAVWKTLGQDPPVPQPQPDPQLLVREPVDDGPARPLARRGDPP